MAAERFKPVPSEHDRNMAVDMEAGAYRQMEADIALIEATESEIEALVIADHNSSGQIAYNIVQLLLGKIRGQA